MTPEAEKAIEDAGYTPGIMEARVSGHSILISPEWAPYLTSIVAMVGYPSNGKEPLDITSETVAGNVIIAKSVANARRMIDCWNSCVGMTNKELDALRAINSRRKSDRIIAEAAAELVKARMRVSDISLGMVDGDLGDAEWIERSDFRHLARVIERAPK